MAFQSNYGFWIGRLKIREFILKDKKNNSALTIQSSNLNQSWDIDSSLRLTYKQFKAILQYK